MSKKKRWYDPEIKLLVESWGKERELSRVPFDVAHAIKKMAQPWDGESHHCPLAWLRKNTAWMSFWKKKNLKEITDVVHVGIGGSLLGMQMVDGFLNNECDKKRRIHFLSELEGSRFQKLTKTLNPENTLILFVSKSFQSQEVLHNFARIQSWQNNTNQLYAVTAYPERALDKGLLPTCILGMPKWLSGRFSVWSACSSSLLLAYGEKVMEAVLHGGSIVDLHVENNMGGMPLLFAQQELVKAEPLKARFVACYGEEFSNAIEYLQQIHMESLGKNVDLNGKKVAFSQVVFGGQGTEYQHAVTQMLAQGAFPIGMDIIASKQKPLLLSHAVAQAKTLHYGVTNEDPRKQIEGKTPINFILMEKPTAKVVGALMALYEYKIWFCSQWLGVHAFDQWGVEHGKKKALEVMNDQQKIEEDELLDWWSQLTQEINFYPA